VARDNQPAAQPVKHPARENHFAPVIEDAYYSVGEIAQMWKLSRDSVRRIFSDEPGVLAISPRQRRGKRAYVTLRIPASVVERVHRKMSLVR
jgi:hypothetical protein